MVRKVNFGGEAGADGYVMPALGAGIHAFLFQDKVG